ncbi:uncharacterized protein LOC122400320 [Colletes gigas]|uniref:uncharacterized protein LOC122400320 n=1 Tax=Colletes gigas TaxID=935657 RepID=UPI001C9A4D9E|nr:uncharacterized protein LOC122400320 [Colletes gigas]
MELELRNALTKKKKKKRYNDETNSQSFMINTNKSQLKNSDSDNSSENSISVNKTTAKEGMQKSFEVFDRNKMKKFGNKNSTNLEEFETKSVNVFVDIHREYKAEKCHAESIEKNETADEKAKAIGLKEPESFKIFSRTNTFHEKKDERSYINPVKYRGLKEEDDDIEVVESIDLIEEFQESSMDKLDEKRFGTRKSKSTKKHADQFFVEEKFHSRRQWGARESEPEVPKKSSRKRWSKDTSVFRLPDGKGNSWTTSSTENVFPSVQDLDESKQKSLSGFDNAAFVSDNEEILRIETDHENARIVMKEVVNASRKSDLSLVERNIPKETAITIENLDVSKDLTVKHFESRNRNTVLDVESIDDTPPKNKNRHSNGNDKRYSDDSNTLHSLENVTVQSDHRSSEEVLIKDDRRQSIKKIKRTRKKHSVDDEIPSSRHTTSTTEDDDLNENRSRESIDEDKSKSSVVKRRKSTHTEYRYRSQSGRDKKKSHRKNVSDSSVRSSCLNTEADSKKKKKKKKDTKYILVIVHRVNTLEIDYITRHPMVKVHIVKTETGEYLKSESSKRAYLQPVITGKFDFKENRSIVPVWEEELVFEHNFETLLNTDGEQIVILFEIVDLLSFAEASFNYDKFGAEGCWHKIAWAFLRPVGRNNVFHVNKMVRLQLYKPRKNVRKLEGFCTCEAYTWWKSGFREKYPSSLFVTMTSIEPPKLEPVFYQQLSLHDLSDVRSESQKASTHTSDSIDLPKWTRLAAQSCKVPNESIFETDVSENGCFFVAFSNDGKYLACSHSEEHDYPIVVYEVIAKKVYVRFSGHKTFVYSLHWSNNDKYLLSVSSDQTARIWDVRNQIIQHVEMMPHPSYVYCSKFGPENSSIVATGCYDRIARIWTRNKKSKNRDLSQELEGHEGFINSMCFQTNSNLLTADSIGTIILWTVKRNRSVPSKREWHISRKIRVREIDGVIINTIVLHPLESRLLVHSRNNGLRMLDLATGVVLQKYNELNNQRIQCTACISPCGGLILCGGEDSTLNVWNLESGNLLARYTLDRSFRAVTCVDYHPYDHVLAFSTFGRSAPVRVLKFNKDATGEDVGLKMTEDIRNKLNNDVSARFFNASVTPRERSRSNSSIRTPEEILKERSSQRSRNRKFHFVESPSGVLTENNDKHTDAKLRLLRLNETERALKSQSANRLYNIIEKIDRILSNTSRSSGDVESGRNYPHETSKSRVLTNRNENTEKGKTKIGRKKSLEYCSTDDRSNSYFDSSTGNSVEREVEELKMLRNTKASDFHTKMRSKSAKEKRSNDMHDDVAKTFSDSAANYRKSKIYDEIVGIRKPENIETNFIRPAKENNSKQTNYRGKSSFNNNGTSNSSGSAETYIVEKSNSDEDSMKLLRNENLIQSDTENDTNFIKDYESGSSVHSNATFTIENEIPVPMPRRKKSSLT